MAPVAYYLSAMDDVDAFDLVLDHLGTRRYHLHGKGVYVSALDPMLNKIDPD